MNSKEALEILLVGYYNNANYQEVIEAREKLEKDLDIFECFQKIDKKELKDFIETQIRYALNENTWLSACNCDLEKEKPTKHLIKIKEWLEHEKDNI